MFTCRDIANYFIVRSYEDGREAEMTNMKVQKLLYYAQSLHLALYDVPLFSDEIQAWRHGPVCPPAYRLYNDFEAQQLPPPTKDFLGRIPPEAQKLLEEVWDYFGDYHAYQLSGMTHLEFPWKKARKGLPASAASKEPIALEDMKTLGYQKLEEIEFNHPVYKPLVAELLEQAFQQEGTLERVQKGDVHDWLTSLLD